MTEPTWEKVEIHPYKELLQQLKNIRELARIERAKLQNADEEGEQEDGPVG